MLAKDIEEKVANEFKIAKAQAKRTVEYVFETLAAGLKKDKFVKISSLGTFRLKESPARKGVKVRNPATGETMIKDLPAKKKIKFSAAKALKQKVL